jgi:hypothetical protein
MFAQSQCTVHNGTSVVWEPQARLFNTQGEKLAFHTQNVEGIL